MHGDNMERNPYLVHLIIVVVLLHIVHIWNQTAALPTEPQLPSDSLTQFTYTGY